MKHKKLHQLIKPYAIQPSDNPKPSVRLKRKRKEDRRGKLDIPWSVIVRGRR